LSGAPDGGRPEAPSRWGLGEEGSVIGDTTGASEKVDPAGRLEPDELWYKDAIIYELHVRAFYDSDGDGIGDFRGLIEKLDYLKDLGITCIWLLPFFPSPLKDDGYDISDYHDVHTSLGSLVDFETFVVEAHRRGLRVITELVMNHTSDQHPWFQSARSSKDSPYRDYYVWSDTEDKYKEARIIFTDTERSNWTWDHEAGQYFWHRFFSQQPDLNFDNPEVRRAMIDALKFWLDRGVDGLRLDAVPYLIERDGTNCENLPETHEYIREVRAAIDAQYRDRILLAEANQWPADVRPYFGDDDECHMAFHFPLMPRIFMAIRREERRPITEIMAQTPELPPRSQWAIFLRNHDELTLEMVTDEERDYMYREYARDPKMRINIGIRRRLAPLMENGRRQIELLNGLLLSMPGTPIIYYGDEIGMGDNIYLGDRNGVRTPMQWSLDRNAGFSRADAARLYSPVIVDPVYGYQAINVEAQLRTPTSLLNWMRRIIHIRKRYKAFGRGSLRFLHPENPRILAYIREYEQEKLLIVNNLSRFAQPVEMDLREFAGCVPVELFGETPFPRIGEWPYMLSLGPHGFLWFRLESAGAA
jgi:maltose alpha-D-glucosyltransferase / alpha-amylase